jgi:hypothetical protein
MKLTPTAKLSLLETWTVHNPKGIGGEPHTDDWTVHKSVEGNIIVSNITCPSFITQYPADMETREGYDWRTRLTQLVCYYLRADVVKILTSDGEVKPGITCIEWYAKEY